MTKTITQRDIVADDWSLFEHDEIITQTARVEFFTDYIFGSLLLMALAAVLGWLVIGYLRGSPLAPLAYLVLLSCYYLALTIRSDIWRWVVRGRINEARRQLGLPEGDFGLLEDLDIVED